MFGRQSLTDLLIASWPSFYWLKAKKSFSSLSSYWLAGEPSFKLLFWQTSCPLKCPWARLEPPCSALSCGWAWPLTSIFNETQQLSAEINQRSMPLMLGQRRKNLHLLSKQPAGTVVPHRTHKEHDINSNANGTFIVSCQGSVAWRDFNTGTAKNIISIVFTTWNVSFERHWISNGQEQCVSNSRPGGHLWSVPRSFFSNVFLIILITKMTKWLM